MLAKVCCRAMIDIKIVLRDGVERTPAIEAWVRKVEVELNERVGEELKNLIVFGCTSSCMDGSVRLSTRSSALRDIDAWSASLTEELPPLA